MPDYQLQAAALPFRDGQICLVTSRRKARWVIPKGRIERGHTALQAAEIEAWEEAGLIGTMRPVPLGRYHYEKMDRGHIVSVFAMDVTIVHPTWPEFRVRTREWVSVDEALNRIEEAGLRSIIQMTTLIDGSTIPAIQSHEFPAILPVESM